MKNKLVGSVILLIFALLFTFGATNASALSLTTTYAGGNGQDGNMFSITALNAVTITGFDGNLDPPSDNYRIYYKTGTYQGFEANPGAWTLVGTANNVTSAGANVPTHIPITVNVAIPAGQTYSFYITTDGTGSGVRYTDGSTEGAVYVQDSNIQILEGIGVEYPFGNGGNFYTPRVWNGTVYYELGAATATAVPTLSEWGMIAFMAMAGLLSVYYLRRRKATA
ncbi:MAG: IPTL-CTERM sorting domain-containing protein [Nitrospiraceae bacterium]|nr:IPTL-CTERM sorting domain-containing protein [Nitrospiraceae bacterium]